MAAGRESRGRRGGGGGREWYLIGILAVIRARFGNSSLDCEITFNDIFGAPSPPPPPPPTRSTSLYSSSPPSLPISFPRPAASTRPPSTLPDGEGLHRAQYKSLVTRSEQMCFRTYSE